MRAASSFIETSNQITYMYIFNVVKKLDKGMKQQVHNNYFKIKSQAIVATAMR